MRISYLANSFATVRVSLLIIFCCFTVSAFTQVVDTSSAYIDSSSTELKKRNRKPANIAARRSAFLPGMGQVYNKQYWKAPIALGSFSLFTVNAIRHGDSYRALSRAGDTYPQTVKGKVYNTESQLANKLRLYKTRRNRNIAGAAGVYTFNIIDAFVSAKIKEENRDHSPAKAGYYAAFAPGMGQFYNGKYWKMPIVYAAFGACTYSIIVNTTNYNKYRRLFIGSQTTTITIVIEGQEYTPENLLELRNYYRRNLDLSYIAFSAVYLLQIVDAVVDGHLSEFDNNDFFDDNNMSVSPFIHSFPHDFQSYPGVLVTFRL